MRTGRVVATLLLSSGLCGAARADAPSGVLVLPTQVAGNVPDRAGLQRQLDERLERVVVKSGRTTKPTGPLTSAEASCRAAECLGKIAEGAGAQSVLGARVSADRGSPPSYRLVVELYDRDRPGAVHREDAECSVCTEAETADRLEQVAATLLPLPTAPVVAPTPTPIESVTQPPPAPPPSKAKWYAAIGATSALTVGGIVMLGLGGKALAIDGTGTGGSPPKYLYDTHGTGVGLIAVGSIVTVGALVGLTISAIKLKRAH